MIKVLWLSNFRFGDGTSAGSGSWINAMGRGIAASNDCQLANVTLGGVSKTLSCDACNIRQWVLPIGPVIKRPMIALPPQSMINEVIRIEQEFRPDLIHVWGTERFWALLTARKMLKAPALLEMQGIPSAMSPYMTGCLTQVEVRDCFGLKEWLRPGISMQATQKQFVQAVKSENEMYAAHSYIDYQSDWVRSYVAATAPRAKLFKTRMSLRREFLKSEQWQYQPDNHTVFTSCGWAANKGLHTLVRACHMLRGRYPDIRLAVAGDLQKGIRRSGYAKWLLREIHALGVKVDVLGALDEIGMIRSLQGAAVYVNPSLVESYSMSLAEAMAVGCPCAVSYAGAMPEVGGEDCFYFPIADAGMCSARIEQVFEMRDRAAETGERARERSLTMHDGDAAVKRQLAIYEEVLKALK